RDVFDDVADMHATAHVGDVFDQISPDRPATVTTTPGKAAGDIFDRVAASMPKVGTAGDIFDRISRDPVKPPAVAPAATFPPTATLCATRPKPRASGSRRTTRTGQGLRRRTAIRTWWTNTTRRTGPPSRRSRKRRPSR